MSVPWMCPICGTAVPQHLEQDHFYKCRSQLAARLQTIDTYFGYPVNRRTKSDEELLEELIVIRDTNPDSIEAGYDHPDGKES